MVKGIHEPMSNPRDDDSLAWHHMCAANRFQNARDAARMIKRAPELAFHYRALALVWLKRAFRNLEMMHVSKNKDAT